MTLHPFVMQYEEEIRRFNFLGGLLLGSLLGTAATLAVRPFRRPSRTERARRAVLELGKSAGSELREWRDELAENVESAARSGRARFWE